MIKAAIGLQELRRRMYHKAKSEKTHRFWGIFVHIAKIETLQEAPRNPKKPEETHLLFVKKTSGEGATEVLPEILRRDARIEGEIAEGHYRYPNGKESKNGPAEPGHPGRRFHPKLLPRVALFEARRW